MFSMLFTVSETQLPTGTTLPCSVLILSMAKNQSDVENLVKNCLIEIFGYRQTRSDVVHSSFSWQLFLVELILLCQYSHRQQIATTKCHRCVLTFKRENDSITFSDRQTFVIDNIKFVSVKTVADHKISSMAESHR